MIRQHNDANMLAIGARVVGEGLALDIVDAFLAAEFEGGRHAARDRGTAVLSQSVIDYRRGLRTAGSVLRVCG